MNVIARAPAGARSGEPAATARRILVDDSSAPSDRKALEGNVRVCYVKDGKRDQIASWRGKVTSGMWHTCSVDFRGGHVVVTRDGALDHHHDRTFSRQGTIGLRTRADAVTCFDDHTAEPL